MSIETEITRLTTAKQNLNTWLTNNGITVPSGALLDESVSLLGNAENFSYIINQVSRIDITRSMNEFLGVGCGFLLRVNSYSSDSLPTSMPDDFIVACAVCKPIYDGKAIFRIIMTSEYLNVYNGSGNLVVSYNDPFSHTHFSNNHWYLLIDASWWPADVADDVSMASLWRDSV